jgi:hypothetical protein
LLDYLYLFIYKTIVMQKTDQPLQQTDKNKGDQSAVEQQQKEQTGKKPAPENMSGSQNAQQGDQADQQVTGRKQHVTNNDGAAINASDEEGAEGKMGNQQQKTMESKNMGQQDQGGQRQDGQRQGDQGGQNKHQGR